MIKLEIRAWDALPRQLFRRGGGSPDQGVQEAWDRQAPVGMGLLAQAAPTWKPGSQQKSGRNQADLATDCCPGSTCPGRELAGRHTGGG